MTWKSFIKSRQFAKHLGAAILLTMLLSVVVLMSMSRYTRHGKEMEMPELLGKTMEELDVWSDESHMDFIVTDSVFNDELPGGTVYTQYPYPGAMIKKGRQVYITLVANSREKVTMPDLRDFTVRQAVAMLETYRLSVDSMIFVPDFGRTVIEARLGYEVIEPGELVPKGTAIILVVGSGQSGDGMPIPFLIGKSRAEALRILASSFLNAGAEFYPDADTSDLVVERQKPPYRSSARIPMGTGIDLWYVDRASFDLDAAMRQLELDSIAADSLAREGRHGNDTSLQKF